MRRECGEGGDHDFRGSPQPAHSQTNICSKLNQSLCKDAEELDSSCVILPVKTSDRGRERGNKTLKKVGLRVTVTSFMPLLQ